MAEDVNKLDETTCGRPNVTVVVAKLTDVNSLVEAFNGCRGVFHTSSSIDPAGLSGYTVRVFSFTFSWREICCYLMNEPSLPVVLTSDKIVLNLFSALRATIAFYTSRTIDTNFIFSLI